jgi:hypothetical protein
MLIEHPFFGISVDIASLKLFLTEISDEDPPQLPVRIAIVNELNYFVLGSFVNEIRFGEDPQGPSSFRVNLASHLDDFLGRNVNICWDHSQHYRPLVLHVTKDHIPDQRDIIFCSPIRCCILEDPRDVDDAQVTLVRATNF